MYRRIFQPSIEKSFFLLGPQGVGKRTILTSIFSSTSVAKFIDLNNKEVFEAHQKGPAHLIQSWKEKKGELKWILISGIQKLPELLEQIHEGIDKHQIKFAFICPNEKLAEKVNELLQDKVNAYYVHPLCSSELNESKIEELLNWGTLPQVLYAKDQNERVSILENYLHSYVESQARREYGVKKLHLFKNFMKSVGLHNGEILNFATISQETLIERKTVERYFHILADTMLLVFLQAYDQNIRKRQAKKPRFFFFDLGVLRAAQEDLETRIKTEHPYYSLFFKNFVILEIIRFCHYSNLPYTFSYLKTKDGPEIDLIVERPDKATLLIGISALKNINKTHLKTQRTFQKIFPNAQSLHLTLKENSEIIEGVEVLFWKDGLKKII